MAIPRKVANQGLRAEEIRKKVYEEGKTPEELGVKGTPAPGEAPTEDPETPVIEDPNTDPGKVTPPIDYKVKYEEAVHQINTLKGKLDSEVPELVSTNRMMAGEIANLQATVSDLQTKIKQPATEPENKTDPQETTDLKLYQDNYPEIHRGQIIVMKQWVKSDEFKDMVAAIVDTLVQSKVEPRVASVEKEVKNSKEDSFASKMDTLVKDKDGNPCWRQLNDDKDFVGWLKENRYGGFSKLELLRAALAKGDAEGVAEYFNDWLKTKIPPPVPPETPAPDKKGGNGKPEEEVAIAPARPGGGQPPKKPGNGEDKPTTFTRSFVKKFHTDVALGRYKNRPKEREKITAEINEAMAKGLIVNG